ncbi:hypothetical protein D9619_009248 [Psilocybe cf. subviscida]|uniref:Uncharacterized protein n=1 Tax=Psilocybe cf. subviscida TaxID=2480587 RepID=A0A8H5BU74_9AGAR|nr:hypothetical protein D9619_009248 [Psilocybe cf. subviscida]
MADTVVFHPKAFAGADVRGRSKVDEASAGHDLIQTPLIEGFLPGGTGGPKDSALLDEILQMHVVCFYSDNEAIRVGFDTSLLPSADNGRSPAAPHVISLSD